MQNELHERLEYLVNYSSQLIFVSGDSIAQQQKTLEAFVFQQHDDTEIAYLTAQDTMEVSDYRRQLCRQLLGQVVGSFVRPLNELLVDLNNHDGPILIAITQSHHLPDTFLQELWDLVLQSRFAGNKQHLNVLLFADSQWAERAKQWLPAKNTETPLIISSQSVMDEQPIFTSDLDKMIATRREAFQAHLDNRQQQTALTFINPLKSRWLYVLLLCVFVSTFSGLVYWQYGDDIASLFTPIESTEESNATFITPGSAYDQIAAQTNGDKTLPDAEGSLLQAEGSLLTADGSTPQADGSLPQAEGSVPQPDGSLPQAEGSTPQAEGSNLIGGAATIKGANDINSTDSQSIDLASRNATPQSNEPTKNQPEALVTSWQNAISKNAKDLSKQDNAISNNAVPARSPDIAESTENFESKDSLLSKEMKGTDSALAQSPASASAAKSALDVANGKQTPLIAPTEYALQMLAMKNKQVLSDFIEENNLREQTQIYKTLRYGGDWYVVIYAQTYPSAEQAQQAKQRLPNYPNKASAFVKNGQQILREIALAKNE